MKVGDYRRDKMTEKRKIEDVSTEELLSVIREYNQFVRLRKPIPQKYVYVVRAIRMEIDRRKER